MCDKPVSVIITDLDNTLFDWFGPWYGAFKAVLEHLVRETGLSEARILDDVKAVHQRYGTSEYALLLRELSYLHTARSSRPQLAARSAQAYRDAQRATLCLHKDVLDTLLVVRETGCLLIGYTESQALYSAYRLHALGLDGLIDVLYSPPSHGLPEDGCLDHLSFFPLCDAALRHTQHRVLPAGEYNPNPARLTAILSEVGARPAEAIYIGDSLSKDVVMAQACGVRDVYAEYGARHHRLEYELLRAVTHWTPEQVERERCLRKTEARPSYTLHQSFGQLVDLFRFTSFTPRQRERARASEPVEAC